MIGVKITNKISEKLFGIIKGEEKSGRGLKVEQANYVLIIAKLSIIKANFFDKCNIEEFFENEIIKRQKYLQTASE